MYDFSWQEIGILEIFWKLIALSFSLMKIFSSNIMIHASLGKSGLILMKSWAVLCKTCGYLGNMFLTISSVLHCQLFLKEIYSYIENVLLMLGIMKLVFNSAVTILERILLECISSNSFSLLARFSPEMIID